MCNRAIMIITDGAPETFEDIFQNYNWPEKFVSNILLNTCTCHIKR